MRTKASNDTKSILSHLYQFNIKVLFESIFIGLFSGLIVVAYRLAIHESDDFRHYIYDNIKDHNGYWIVILFVLLTLIGFLLNKIMKKAPMAKGSGIPQIKGYLMHKLELNWLKDILVKFFGGVLALGAGLSLGREGPSIQIGASTGLGFSKTLKRSNLEERYLITAGASAGLSAAFNAPMAGVMFALEELHRHFSPVLLISSIAASVTADFVSRNFFGLDPIFSFENIQLLPLKYYGYVILLGILIGFLGKTFNFTLLFVQKHYSENKKIKNHLKIIIPLLISGVIGLTLPQVLGGGSHLIKDLNTSEIVLSMIVILFVVKLLFTALSYGTGVPGGIFLPILVLGALVGKGFGVLLIENDFIAGDYVLNFMTLAMAAYFTAVVKAPITGSILIMEMTGSLGHFLPLIIVSLTAYVVADFVNSKPIYVSLLERFFVSEADTPRKTKKGKAILEMHVAFGSEIEHKKLRDVELPEHCQMVSIRRGEEELIPNNNLEVLPGDCLIIIAEDHHAPELRETLQKFTEEPGKHMKTMIYREKK